MIGFDLINGDKIIRLFCFKGYKKEDVEDALQEVFLKISQKPPQKISETYIQTGVWWQLSNTLKKKHPQNFTDMGIKQEEIYGENREFLKEFLFKLPARTQKAIHMRYWCNYSRKEIAEKLGIGEHGAKNILQRGKKKLKEMICQEKNI